MSDELIKSEEHETFQISERSDEEQILSQLQGRSTEKMIYSFNSGGMTVEGLSYSGTLWAKREYSRHGEVIRLGKPEIVVDPSDPQYLIATVEAKRFAASPETGTLVELDNAYGIKRRSKTMKLRDGRTVEDPFWVEKLTSMAARNALKSILPASFVLEVLKRIKSGKATDVAPPSQRPVTPSRRPVSPPPQEPLVIPESDPGANFEMPPTSAPETETVPAARPAAPKAAATGKAAKPAPAAPEDQASPPRSPAQGPAAPAGLKVGQRLLMNMKKILPDEAACRATLKALTGKDKTRDLDDKTLEHLNAEIVKSFPGGPNELVEGGTFLIVKATKAVLLPKGGKLPAAPPPPAADPTEETPPPQAAPPPTEEEPLF